MNVGDQLTIGGRTAEVIKVRKTAPVAVVEFGDGSRELHWYGDEPSAPAESAGNGASAPATEIPDHSPSLASHGHETPRQARRWQQVYGWYDRAGLCPRCCAQGAWGHQLGFSNVKPPCNPCAVIVAEFPAKVSNGWCQLTQRTAPQFALTAVA